MENQAEFIIPFKKTGKIEGGFSNDPRDRGGMTFCGIARNYWPDCGIWVWIDAAINEGRDPNTLCNHATVQRLVEDFYRERFWAPLRLNELPQLIADELYDSAVNVSVQRAATWLQHAVNLMLWESWPLVEDGKVGPRTIAAANHAIKNHGAELLDKFLDGLQFEHYHRLAMADVDQLQVDPSFGVRWVSFIRGWVKNRIFERIEK